RGRGCAARRSGRPARAAWNRATWRRASKFFFSSRRRHTRFDCDWSSDVCSSDLCTEIASIDITSLSDAEAQTHSLEQMKQFAISEPVERFYEKGIDKGVLAHAFKSVPEMVLIALGYDEIGRAHV